MKFLTEGVGKVREILNELGIELFGTCKFDDFKNRLLECKAKSKLSPNLKTIISVAIPYKVKEAVPKNISRYSCVTDYHIVLGKKLQTACEKLKQKYNENEFWWFVDSSPIPEVDAAQKAGLGVKGENGLLITEKYGSFVFLGEILTDKVFDYNNANGVCIGCGKCKKSCPNKELNKGKCLSDITQKKGDLSFEEQQQMKQYGTVWGCDICQEVCPMNKQKQLTEEPEFVNSYKEEFCFGDKIKGRAFNWRGRKVIERNLEIVGDKNEH